LELNGACGLSQIEVWIASGKDSRPGGGAKLVEQNAARTMDERRAIKALLRP
jgi:hypothetical protein